MIGCKSEMIGCKSEMIGCKSVFHGCNSANHNCTLLSFMAILYFQGINKGIAPGIL
jgi:hypothetical protein